MVAQKSPSVKAMAGGKATPKPPPVPINEQAFDRFLKLSGYKSTDVLGSSARRYVFVTSNGGKYQMNKRGTALKVLQGPQPPRVPKSKVTPLENGGSLVDKEG